MDHEDGEQVGEEQARVAHLELAAAERLQARPADDQRQRDDREQSELAPAEVGSNADAEQRPAHGDHLDCAYA